MSSQRTRPSPARRARPTPAARRAPTLGPKRGPWIIGGVVAVILIAAIVAVVASSGGGGGGGGGAKGAKTVEVAPVSVRGTLPVFNSASKQDPAVGLTAPDLTGKSFDGSTITIANDGKPRVIVFVAHWCPHCQAEVPRLVALAKSGAFEGIEVTAVATGTSPNFPNYPPSAWLQREHWPFPVMLDSKTFTAANAYGLPSYPYFVFIDANGKVAGRGIGEATPNSLATILEALAQGKPLPIAGASGGASSPGR